MDEKTLFAKLEKRLSFNKNDLDKIVHLISRYNLKINIRNFDQYGLLLYDQDNKSVRIIPDAVRDQSLVRLSNPQSNIAVIYCNGILSGWIESSSLEDIGDMMILDIESLHKMPDDFRFVRECPHMDIHGGFSLNGNGWYCFNCKEKLVFNED
jgi:sRNA-binding regulator protein Hfq